MLLRRRRASGARANGPVFATDYEFGALSLASSSRRDVVLSAPPVLDQGRFSACTGFELYATIGAMEAEVGLPARPVSPWWCYWHGREVDGIEIDDSGARPRSVYHAVRHRGAADFDEWKRGLLGWRVNRRPSRKAHRGAYDRRGLSYYFLRATGESRIEQIDAALDAGLPVGMSFIVRDSFYGLKAPAHVDGFSVTDAARGGHRVAIMARVGGRYGVMNSWGTAHGDGGWSWWSPSALMVYAYDLSVVTGWELLGRAPRAPAHYLQGAMLS